MGTTTRKSTANHSEYKRIMREHGEKPESMGVTDIWNILIDLAGSLKKKKTPDLCREFLRLRKLLTELRVQPVCPHCGGSLYLSDVEGYDYVCPHCDENFFEFEIQSSGE